MDRQAGFTLIETLVGAAIAAAMIWALVVMADRLAAGAAAANRRVVASANVGRLVERLSSEAASALAIDVPATDVLGAANSDGHEIDFSTQDGAHRTYAWTYTFDNAAQTLTRYALNGTGAPVAGEVLSDIDSFSAVAATVTQLGVPSSPAYDPLFAGTHAIDVPGNRLVVVQVVASGVDRSVLLASEDAPTAFTVVVTYTPSPSPVVTPTPSPVPMW